MNTVSTDITFADAEIVTVRIAEFCNVFVAITDFALFLNVRNLVFGAALMHIGTTMKDFEISVIITNRHRFAIWERTLDQFHWIAGLLVGLP